MSKQFIELLLVQIELLVKKLLHFVVPSGKWC